MPEASDYTIHGNHQHFGWDNSIPPVSTISPGAVVEFECDDASAGHITDQSTADDISTIDFARINPVTGPIFIDGAKPGDTLTERSEQSLDAERVTDPFLRRWLDMICFLLQGTLPSDAPTTLMA